MTTGYPPSPDQQDTAAYARPQTEAGGPGWYVPGQPVGRSNPEADYWAGKYRRQRRWTRALAATTVAGMLAAVGLGVVALGSDDASPVASSSDLATSDGTGQTPDGSTGQAAPNLTTPDGSTDQGAPDTTTPDGSTPNGTTPEQTTPDSGSVPLDSLPLPDSLKSLAQTFGITDLDQLVQLAVSSGLISQEDAANLLATVKGGTALGDLLGGDQGGSSSDGGQSAPNGGSPTTPQGGTNGQGDTSGQGSADGQGSTA